MRDINITKYRKLLANIQMFCRENKTVLYRFKPDKKLTDYERGRIAGEHRAYNNVMKHVNNHINTAEYDWNSMRCRDEEPNIKKVEVNYITQNGPRFKVGQKVWVVHPVVNTDIKRIHVQCDMCNSTGKIRIVGKDGEYTCPFCHGETKEVKLEYKYVIKYSGATIGRVEYLEYSDKYKKKGIKFKTKATYLLEETGVEHGGATWYEHHMFASEDEAQDFCDKYIPSNQFNSCDPILKSGNEVD